MMARMTVIASLALVMVMLPAVAQQHSPVEIDFEADTGAFISADPTAEFGLTHDPDLVFSGTGSLEFRYIQTPFQSEVPEWGLPGALILPLPHGVPGMTEISFALRSKLPTPVVIALGLGDDGPRFNRVVWSAAERWSEFTLSLEDFIFDRDGPGSPEDPLDPAQLAHIAVIDGHGFVRMIAEESPLIYVDPPAEQTLWLDDFVLRAGEPGDTPEPTLPRPLAEYSSPMHGFLPVGGRDLTVSSEDGPEGEPALRVDYTIPPLTLFGLMHSVAPGALADAEAISFSARTNRPVTLLVTLEERREPGELGKSRYQQTVELRPSGDFEAITLPLSLFELGDDQVDPDGALNAELVETAAIIDATAAFEASEVINTLRLTAPSAVE